jgi:hypothetical protein
MLPKPLNSRSIDADLQATDQRGRLLRPEADIQGTYFARRFGAALRPTISKMHHTSSGE